MFVSSLITVLATTIVANAQSSSVVPAPAVTNNPIGAQYIVSLPAQTKNTVRGTVSGTTNPNGKGVKFDVSISGLPSEGGPFIYHIHEKPVPADGNCTGTGAHLDPYKRGETPPCDATAPETCQVGDLSGKHGSIANQSLSVSYTDAYASTDPSNPAYFGNLSVVVHLANKTRISCANFTLVAKGAVSGGVSVPTSIPSGTGIGSLNSTATATATGLNSTSHPTSKPPTPTQPTTSSTGAATKLAAGAGALAFGVFALLL